MPRTQSLDELIAHHAAVFADQVRLAAEMADNEEEIKIAIETQLAFIKKEAGIEWQGKHEVTVVSGRIDSVYDRVIIEYKNPASGDKLGPKADSPGTKKVVEQIKKRFYDLRAGQGHKLNTLFGVGADGRYFVFVRFRDDKWQVQEPVEVNRYSAERFLWALYNLGQKGKPFTAEYLAGDFGSEAKLAQDGIRALYEAIKGADHPKAQTFFNQWKILFGEVCGYDVDSPSDKIKKLAAYYGIREQGLAPAEMLFAVHTYYAVFMKLLASEIVAFFHKLPTPLQKMIQALSTDKFLQECEAESLPLTDVELHRDLYGALVALQAEGKNGIWGKIVKNAFAPLFAGHFDYVAGNPPWINWEHLPSDYRTATEGIWKRYRLTGRIPIPKRQQSYASKTDISILMTYVSADKYLVAGGRLGFVITRSVFQSELGGWHFRAFRLPDSTPLGVLAVHDVDNLKPFRGQAANVTCTFSIGRDRKTEYPARWVSWNAPDGVEVQEDTPIDEVQGTCVRNDWVARPVDSSQPQSSWIFGSANAQNIAMRMIAKSYYAEYAREGVNTRGANGVYFVDAFKVGGKLFVRNRPSDGDDDEVQVREQAIEPDFLYPLLRGRNVARWSATPQSYIVLPHHEDEPTTAVPFSKLPQATRSFLNHFKGKLRGRKKFRNFDPTGTSWHGLYSVLRATFAPYKVVWREMASGTLAAVVASAVLPTGEEQIVIPDHKLFIIPCVGEEEAHFVCGLFNSAICEYVIRSYAISTGISTHVLDRLPIPRFDGKNKDHIAVANAALQCAGAIVNGQATSQHEESLNVAALRVFGVDSQDAKVIENALVAIR